MGVFCHLNCDEHWHKFVLMKPIIHCWNGIVLGCHVPWHFHNHISLLAFDDVIFSRRQYVCAYSAYEFVPQWCCSFCAFTSYAQWRLLCFHCVPMSCANTDLFAWRASPLHTCSSRGIIWPCAVLTCLVSSVFISAHDTFSPSRTFLVFFLLLPFW